MPAGTLYLVATPIGNLGDISGRAAQTLSDADFIAAEDTRVAIRLLNHLGIKKHIVSYHAHSGVQGEGRLLARLLSGESCALVTDAGTPAISDPGEKLVSQCALAGVDVVAVPGPCAAIAALTVSGLPAGRFTFEGFLSTAKRSRQQHLDGLRAETRTMVFYEAPHKLLRTLRDLRCALGDRRVSISREMTKLHEQTLRATLSDTVSYFEANVPRGEFAIVIEGAPPPPPDSADMESAVESVNAYADAGMKLRDAAGRVSCETGLPKNALYGAAQNSRSAAGDITRRD
ncbi:MAG: 16S rRNA (cytidine(1402)-2'-O)-methyltransferase [Oscillospiraceae bacterium]|jgi:16S rRNA (cytidine1402-2'-O)-methyltransferase|nr:16S rRNA (cytidine(1402)-2'-O)-methyltransferase [Oscillospiraceae bacterium]